MGGVRQLEERRLRGSVAQKCKPHTAHAYLALCRTAVCSAMAFMSHTHIMHHHVPVNFAVFNSNVIQVRHGSGVVTLAEPDSGNGHDLDANHSF
jgi:hypothetical protein